MSRHGRGHGSPKKRMRETARRLKREGEDRANRERRQRRQEKRIRELAEG